MYVTAFLKTLKAATIKVTIHTTAATLHSAHRAPLCVLHGFQNEQRLLIYTALTDFGPGVDSASNRNEYQEDFLGVNAAGA